LSSETAGGITESIIETIGDIEQPHQAGAGKPFGKEADKLGQP
jgi:hypothetical protein